ncbi:MAG: ribosome biogenesis GTP-binding protein YihA/YsxC [Ignavibacteria bacterium]|jgi:GTP-binding protein
MKNARFLKSVFHLKDLPKLKLPEVILCGRSNVGKSSFLNSLFNSKNLAKTSSSPGKTRSLNYYSVDDKIYLVDLPGFGYAKVSESERRNWEKLVNNYIKSDRDISLAFHFIDSRHKPFDLDIALNAYLRELEIPYYVILSKVDKLNQKEKSAAVKTVTEFFPELLPEDNLIFYSSPKGIGKKEIIKKLNSLYFR